MTSSVEASSVASLCLMSRSNKHSLRCHCCYSNIYKEVGGCLKKRRYCHSLPTAEHSLCILELAIYLDDLSNNACGR